MTLRLPQVGDRILDMTNSSAITTRPSTYTVIMRYSAGMGNDVSATQWKLCPPGEVKRLFALGYDVIANSEWTTGRILDGAGAGKADGTNDLSFWKARAYAQGASIYVSWDQESNSGEYDAAEAYLEAYEKALGGYYHVDLYADDPAIKEMQKRGRIKYGWRSMSDSFSNDGKFYQPGDNWLAVSKKVAAVSTAHLWQSGDGAHGGDQDIVLRTPIGSHKEALSGGNMSVDQPLDTADATVVLHSAQLADETGKSNAVSAANALEIARNSSVTAATQAAAAASQSRANGGTLSTLTSTVNSLAASVSKIPTTAPVATVGEVQLSSADKDDIAARVVALLGKDLATPGA